MNSMLRRLRSHLDTAVDKVWSTESKDDGEKPLKFDYSRPEFLKLNAEKMKVSQDFMTRPIVTSNEPMTLPFNAGYAEYCTFTLSFLGEGSKQFCFRIMNLRNDSNIFFRWSKYHLKNQS